MQAQTETLSVEIPSDALEKLKAEADKQGVPLAVYTASILSRNARPVKRRKSCRPLSKLLGKDRIQRLWDEAMETCDLLSDEDCRNLGFIFVYSLMHLNLLLLQTRDDEWPAELQGALEMLTTIGNSANIMDGTTILLRKRGAKSKRPSLAEHFSFFEDEDED